MSLHVSARTRRNCRPMRLVVLRTADCSMAEAMRPRGDFKRDNIQHTTQSAHDALGAVEKAPVWGAARTGRQAFMRK